MKIGIVNIMPKAEQYEPLIEGALRRANPYVEIVWIRLVNHTYQSSDRRHIAEKYLTFKAAISHEKIDGLIVTGAPVEHLAFEEVHYWQELRSILLKARSHRLPVLGLCWGGLAIAYVLGIQKTYFDRKLFGVYRHMLLGENEAFFAPQSRHAGLNDRALEAAFQSRTINLLAWAKEAGYTVFETTDRLYTVHLGHPEYDPARLLAEYFRDLAAGRKDVAAPENLDIVAPSHVWLNHQTTFFSGWLELVKRTANWLPRWHEQTPRVQRAFAPFGV